MTSDTNTGGEAGNDPVRDATTVRRHILVNAPIGEAFKVFTERFGDFTPREQELEHRNLDRHGSGWESVRRR